MQRRRSWLVAFVCVWGLGAGFAACASAGNQADDGGDTSDSDDGDGSDTPGAPDATTSGFVDAVPPPPSIDASIPTGSIDAAMPPPPPPPDAAPPPPPPPPDAAPPPDAMQGPFCTANNQCAVDHCCFKIIPPDFTSGFCTYGTVDPIFGNCFPEDPPADAGP